ncbi:hypothetical protein BDV10DRAFT_189500 [Aspergillus recurvatus]
MYPVQASPKTTLRTTLFTSPTNGFNAHINIRTLRRLTRLNQTLAPFPAMPITLSEAHETLDIKTRRVGFAYANRNKTAKMDADMELAFEPAIFRPLKRSVFEVNGRGHDIIGSIGMDLVHLRIKEAGSENGDDNGSKVRPSTDFNNQRQHEQHGLYNRYQTPTTPCLRPVFDASCLCSKSPNNVSTVKLNANKHGGDNDEQQQPANSDPPEPSPNPPPLCSCTTKSSTAFTSRSSETDKNSYRTANISALKGEQLSVMASSLNDELTTPSKDYAPLFLPHAPPIFRPNPGQILLRHASSLCRRIENVVESESTRSSISIGNLDLSEESRCYQYPWKVQDVYVDYDDFGNGNPRANTIATVLVGAGGMDDTICIAELKAAVGVLLWGYEHSSDIEGYHAAKPISVLVLSYIGSGHGRILQAHHDGRNLVVQYSPLMTFNMGDNRAESAFIRYTAGRPLAV